jgi:hypothetical protein
MSNNKLKKFLEIKKKVEEDKRKDSQVEGALGEVMNQLKSEFGCSTLKEANQKLKKWRRQKAKIEDEFEEAVEQYELRWVD